MITRTPLSKVYSPGPSGSNPFDSDSDSDTNYKPARAASAPATSKVKYNSSQPINGQNGGRAIASSSLYSNYAFRNKYMENKSVQELEGYAVYKAEATTQKVNGCLRIAEEIREDASRTLVTLHQQGEKITRIHLTAANIEHDLSRSADPPPVCPWVLGDLMDMFEAIADPHPREPEII